MSGLPSFSAVSADSLLGASMVQKGLQAVVETRDPDVLTFVSSNGSVIPLKRRYAGSEKTSEAEDLEHVDTHWVSDETYGININALLDRIENERDVPAVSTSDSSKDHSESLDALSGKDGKLWTEKWRPHKFLDLVGNERINRRILFWLRQWSPLVFGEELPDFVSDSKRNMRNGKSMTDEADDQFQDPLQRPMKKILLIHGPPGIGKTSVSHVVAKQAGYSVMEINASDERAGERVRHKVQNALFNHTFNDKPVCLIADEIDGSVENGFIRVLLDILRSDSKATQDLITGNGKMKDQFRNSNKHKRGKKRDRVLTRPIIAVCNNVYANALEKLRPHCEIIHFQKPSEDALMERLEYVCKVEGISASKTLLKELAILSQGDVRSSLNNLQFMTKIGSDEGISPARKGKPTSNSNNEEHNDKRKDIGISWFKICNSVFKKDPYLETKIQSNNLLRDVETSGNYERIIEGCFTLFPQVKYSDRGVTKPGRISDWLFFNDRMFQSLFEHNGELLRYCAFTPLEFFLMFGDIANKEELKVKSSSFELREKERACLDLVDTVKSKCSVVSQIYSSRKSFMMEILPTANDLISMDLGRVRDLQTRQQLLDVVLGLFHDFHIEIQQSNNFENRNALIIDPPLDQLVVLDKKVQKDILTKRPSALKFSLAKLEEAKIRKRAMETIARDKAANEENRKKQKLDGNGSRSVDFFKNQYSTLKNVTEQNPDPLSKVRSRPAFSFTRESSPSIEQLELNAANVANNEDTRIWVKYKEGFSNAVRKNITWSQLWE